MNAVADQDHQSGTAAIDACVAVQRMIVLRFVVARHVLLMAVRVAPQHELLEQKEGEQADQHDFHHVIDAPRFERMRQKLEEDRAEQRADRVGHERRDPRRRELQRCCGGQRRYHAPGERGRDDPQEGAHGNVRPLLSLLADSVLREPDQCRHATGFAIASIRKKSRRILEGAKAAAVDAPHAAAFELRPSDSAEIGGPFALTLDGEARRYVGIGESVDDVFADLERAAADRRSEPRRGVVGRDAHGGDGIFQHTARKPAPPRVGNTDRAARSIGEQDRQAIGGRHGEYDAALACHRGVGDRCACARRVGG